MAALLLWILTLLLLLLLLAEPLDELPELACCRGCGWGGVGRSFSGNAPDVGVQGDVPLAG